jgi:putative acetyltransferase
VDPVDYQGVFAVEQAAFGREDEARLVEALRAKDEIDFECVARAHSQVVGHIAFSPLLLERDEETLRGSALAPLAVTPEWQRKGVGSALTRMGLEFCASRGVDVVVVVGEPAYYVRFGFYSEAGRLIESPFPYPYLQALELTSGALSLGGWKAVYASSFGL